MVKTVLHVYPDFIGGGAEVVANLIAQHQIEHFKIVIVTYSSTPPRFEGVNFSPMKKKFGKAGALFTIWQLRQKIREFNPDVVISHLPYLNILSAFAICGRSRRIKHIAVEHLAGAHTSGRLFPILQKKIYLRSEVVCISSEVESYLKKTFGLRKTHLFSNPLEIGSAGSEIIHNREISKYKLLAIGRDAPQKNYGFLLKSFSLLPNSYNLDIYGVNQDSDLATSFNNQEISGRVNFLGFLPREEVLSNMKNYNAFVMTSDVEGEPLALLEAAANGVLVIGRNTPGLGESIIKVGGFFIEEFENELAFSDLVNLLVSKREVNSVPIANWLSRHEPQSASHRYCGLIDA